jgi:hypothetical protein
MPIRLFPYLFSKPYLEVKPDQVKGAIASLSMLSYTGKEIFSSGSDGPNIFATWAFNNQKRDGIPVVAMRLATLAKSCKGEKP